ncbi:MAG: IS21 family transposase [Deltaproteobacteria bacterium]|nr:IS21 family transposase [Deltaproteobacteria bacterium]
MTVTPEIKAEMRRLVLREHLAFETVARRFGVHHSVVRRAIRDDPPGEHKPRQSVLDPFKPYIVQRLTELPDLSGIRLFEEVKKRGYQHGIAILRRYVAKVRAPRPRKAYLRVEVESGEQAQVDWGSFGRFRIGAAQRPLSVFSMVLSWSRAIFLDFSLDQKMDTFLRMHRRALEFFGGAPRRILYDNLKSVVLHHIGATVQFNPQFLAFAGHYLFEPVAAPVRYPEAKGRVESSIKYIRQSFFYGRSFSSLSDLRLQAVAWRDQTANQRIHATTRERPADRLLIERTRLHSLPMNPFDTDLIVFPRVVSKEARVQLDSNTYSVPPKYVGHTVQIRSDDHTVRVICDGDEVAKHKRCWERRRNIEDKAHIEELLERRKAARGPKRRDRLASLSPECRIYLQEVARRPIDLENEVRKLLRLVARYDETEVAQGMAEALGKRTFGARYVCTLIDQARFARGLGEPPEPVVTGNHAADHIVVEPHALEIYDALFQDQKEEKEPDPDSEP